MNSHFGHDISPRGGDSPFIDAAAVDTWDAWFRWREYGALRDLTVDSTWDRVAAALASVESADSAAAWKRRFLDAFGSWRLLLDERILATAGTRKNIWNEGRLVAVLNVAAFVRAPLTSHASFDQAAFEEVAALAVRALDDAAMLVGDDALVERGFSVGIVGLADALELLGLACDEVKGRLLAALVARKLAQGCHRESLQLARERGVSMPCTEEWLARARKHGYAAEIIDEASRLGIRHNRLTAIASRRKLALLANNVADALDPLLNVASTDGTATAADMYRDTPLRGYALVLSRQCPCPTPGRGKCAAISVPVQLQLRAAMQRWIDEPIAYPLLVEDEPDAESIAQWAAMAADLGLPEVTWRKADRRIATRHLNSLDTSFA